MLSLFHRRLSAFVIAAALGLAACGRTPPVPSDDQLAEQLATDLPAYWRTSSFAVSGAQQTEDGGEPVYRARFRADVELTAPTYREQERIGETVLVRRVGRPGEKRTLEGRVTSQLSGDEWTSKLALDVDPTGELGAPIESFKGKVVIAGSEDERRFRLDALTGEWYGTVFDEATSTLYVRRAPEGVGATLMHKGYTEELTGQVRDDGSVVLTGFTVTRQDGKPVKNYYLDTFSLQLTRDGDGLYGTARDEGGQSGRVRLRRVSH